MKRRDLLALSAQGAAAAFVPPADTTRELATRARAATNPQLVLCLDASSSLYYFAAPRFKVQRDGHIRALRDRTVQAALLARRARVRVVFWAGVDEVHDTIPGGRLVEREEDVLWLAAHIATYTPPRALATVTYHLSPLKYAVQLAMATEGRVIVDVSTDQAPAASAAARYRPFRNRLEEFARVTVNVIALRCTEQQQTRLKEMVCTWDGRLFPVTHVNDYAAVLKQKLLHELLA